MKNLKKHFKLSSLIKLLLIIIVITTARLGYNSVESALEQNYQSNNSTINRELPPLLTKETKLKNQLTAAKHDKLIASYHYRQAFSKRNSKDKTLRRVINKRQKAIDRVNQLTDSLATHTKRVNHLKNAYISRANIHNAQFNLTSIAIVVAVIIIFFILGY